MKNDLSELRQVVSLAKAVKEFQAMNDSHRSSHYFEEQEILESKRNILKIQELSDALAAYQKYCEVMEINSTEEGFAEWYKEFVKDSDEKAASSEPVGDGSE